MSFPPSESPDELRMKLNAMHADVEKGERYIRRLKARIAHMRGEGRDVASTLDLLSTFEETQRLDMEHRDRLMRELDDALRGRVGGVGGS